MKAIHNISVPLGTSNPVGNYKLKYNFESNSQRVMKNSVNSSSW
ncbi:TPA: hypothetical protein ACGFUY_002432 [Flavobacterium psychrophilum]